MLAPRIRAVLQAAPPAFAFVLGLALVTTAGAQSISLPLPSTDGPILASVLVGDTLFIGGAFSMVGHGSGGAPVVDATTGDLDASFPQVIGKVTAITDDGAGGWYLGGSFSAVGGQAHQNLAHVLADGSVAAWNSGTNGQVWAMAWSGTTLYIGGTFSTAGGLARSMLAAVDGVTGIPTGWNPGASGAGSPNVEALAVYDTTIYVGGSFDTVGGQSRANLAALSSIDGSPTSWNPGANGRVMSIVPAGSTIYVGGYITTIGGVARNGIAALDAATGTATPWDPNAGSAPVLSLAVSGSTVYAGGYFLSIGGVARNRVAAIDAVTGAPLPWGPGASFAVEALAIGGSTLYAGGQFAGYAMALDAASGSPVGWAPGIGGVGSQSFVEAIAVAGSKVAIGGYFDVANGKPRSHLASVDIVTGQLTSWDPGSDLPVNALVAIGHTVYAGGNFYMLGGAARMKLAAIDAVTGVVNGWSPSIDGVYDRYGRYHYPEVYSLAAGPNTIDVGGMYGQLGGGGGTGSVVDATTGVNMGYGQGGGDPDIGWTGDVAMDAVRTYRASGKEQDGQNPVLMIVTAQAIANPNSTWYVNPSPNPVHALFLDGSTLYVGGAFTSLAGDPRNCLAALDAATGARLPWNPGANADVLAFAKSSGQLYVGGAFAVIAGVPRTLLAALDPGSGAARAWSPDMGQGPFAGGSGRVNTILVKGNTVFAGGDFNLVNGQVACNLVALDVTSIVAVSPPPEVETVVLGPVQPHPMHEAASVRLVVPRAGPVSLALFDVAGRRVRTLLGSAFSAGPRMVEIRRQGLPAGLYIVRLEAGEVRASRRLLIIP